MDKGEGQAKEKEKTNGLVGAKNRGWGGPILGKKKTNELVGAKTGGGRVKPKEKRENKWISRG